MGQATSSQAQRTYEQAGFYGGQAPSVDNVDGDGGRDRTGGAVGAGNHAHAEQHADVGVEVVFDRRRKAERLAAACAHPHRRGRQA